MTEARTTPECLRQPRRQARIECLFPTLHSPAHAPYTMASAFRALRIAQRAPVLRQMPVSRLTSALPRTYATATIREATPDKPADHAEQASEDLSGSDPNMDPMQNGNYPDPSKTSALPLKRQFRDPHAEWWDPQERRNYGEPVHEVRENIAESVWEDNG